MEYTHELKIPKERVAVLIGKNGEVKQEFEEFTNSRMYVDSKEGDVRITGEDSIKLYSAREIVKAIGRGFNPDIARLLLKQDYSLEIIPLQDYVKNKKNHFERVKGRVIGREGKAREIIEQLTDTFISVYGKTVCIIGDSEGIFLAKKAVESIIQGSPHNNVYMFLEKARKRRKEESLKNW